jgi:hypothetical protein
MDNSAPTESRLSSQASREGYSQDGNFEDHGASQTIGHAQPPSRVALGLVATAAGSLTLGWIAFVVWLVLKAWSLL